MKIYELRKIPLFVEKFSRLIPKNMQDDVNKKIRKLRENPYVGKPLSYKYFRELKIGKFRVYYVIFEEEIVVLMVTVSEKKDQQKTIDAIKNSLPYLKNIIKNLKEE